MNLYTEFKDIKWFDHTFRLSKICICYNSRYIDIKKLLLFAGISYRMEGGDFRYGRVEVMIHGKWGTICDRYWDQRDAEVFCRMFGFSTGDAYYDSYKDQGTGKVWGTMFHCKGNEDNLNTCPHEGWKITDSIYCRTHKDDAGVQCYTNGG